MKIGLALSGGGARGFMHLGVLKAFDQEGIRPDIISGASAGAICAAFYTSGYTPDQVMEILQKSSFFKLMRPAVSKTGLLNIEKTASFFKEHLKHTFEELSLPVFINAADLERCKSVYFTKGDLIKPLQASACIPIIFNPVQIDNRLFVDGGILNNMPVEPLLGQCDLIVGVHSNHLGDFKKISNFKNVMERTFHMAVAQNVEARKMHCHLLIEPIEMAAYNIFDVGKAKEIFQIGYQSGLKAVEKIKSILIA